jgi:hypothetical protein
MATDVPFGLSFGDPRRYMGSSPLAEIGKAAKTGLMLYGLQQSGAIAALDKLGVKPNQAGTFSYSNPVAPTGAVPPTGAAMQPVVPNAPTFSTPPPPPAVATPVYDSAPMSTTPPLNIGVDILDASNGTPEEESITRVLPVISAVL